jgi:hypothetical protein
MRDPILELARISLESALFHCEDKESATGQEIECALENIKEAISQIQGAREDAHRMAGRVPVCTELYDMLAPEEAAE